MKEFLKKLAAAEKGMEVVEYAVVAGLIVVGVITIIVSIGFLVSKRFQEFKAASGA